MKSHKGFTLIELLISISILSLLLLVGSYSYSMLSDRWTKELGAFNESFENSKNLVLMQTILNGIMPYPLYQPDKKKYVLFFVGGKESLVAVSTNSLLNAKYPEIFKISVVQDEDGNKNLIYQAKTTDNFTLFNTEQSLVFEREIILFKNIDSFNLSYFGWENIAAKWDENNSKNKSWFQVYSGLDSQLIPSKIEVLLSIDSKPVSIPIELTDSSDRLLSKILKE